MPQMPSTGNPFQQPFGGNAYAPGGALFGQGANMGGGVIPSGGQGAGGGAPTPLQFVQATGGQGMQAAQNPVLPQAPPQLPMPMLPQPTSLAELLSAVPSYEPLGQYGAQNWQLPAYGAPGASGGVAGAAAATQPAQPSAPNIQTGITVPQLGGPAGAPQQPQGAPWMAGSPMASQGANVGYGQGIQPLMGQLGGDYYSQAAPMMLAAQQAQSDAGLGWGGLYNLLQRQQGQDLAQRQTSLFGAMRGLA